MKYKRFKLVVISLFALFLLQSCERLKKKMENRERRLQYFQHTIDSARKEHGKNQDSIRKHFKP
jgi:hypothetical protein